MNKHICALFLLCAGLCSGEVIRNDHVWEQVFRVNRAETSWDIYPVEAVTNRYEYSPAAYRENGRWYEDVTVTNHLYAITWREHRTAAASSPIETLRSNVLAEDLARATNSVSARGCFLSFVSITPYTNTRTYTVPAKQHKVSVPVRLGVPVSVAVSLPYEDILEFLPHDYPDTRIRVETGFDGYILLRFDERTNKLTIKRLFPEALPYEKTPDVILFDRDVVDRTI